MKRNRQRAVTVAGRIDAGLGLDQPAFRDLRALLGDDRFWVKVSCCDRASRGPAPSTKGP